MPRRSLAPALAPAPALLLATLTVCIGALLPATAQAQRGSMSVARDSGPRDPNEITTQLGYQLSLGGTTPAGPRFLFNYARRMTTMVWLDFQLNATFGVGALRGTCFDGLGGAFDCGGGFDANGHAIDALAGVKLKFPVASVPLVPYVAFAGGLVGIFDRPSHDDGGAVVARAAGGLKYFVTRHVGLGGEAAFTLGPAFYSAPCRGCSGHTGFYRAFDFAVGAEFVL